MHEPIISLCVTKKKQSQSDLHLIKPCGGTVKGIYVGHESDACENSVVVSKHNLATNGRGVKSRLTYRKKELRSTSCPILFCFAELGGMTERGQKLVERQANRWTVVSGPAHLRP